MNIKIEEILELKQKLREFNSLDLRDIEWTHYGKEISVSQRKLDDWRFTGLSNSDFIEIVIFDMFE